MPLAACPLLLAPRVPWLSPLAPDLYLSIWTLITCLYRNGLRKVGSLSEAKSGGTASWLKNSEPDRPGPGRTSPENS